MLFTLIALTFLLFVTQLLDHYSTYDIYRRGGDTIFDEEKNSIMRWLFEDFGMHPVLTAKTIAVTFVGWWLGSQEITYQDQSFSGLWLEGAIVLWYVKILLHNWKSMP